MFANLDKLSREKNSLLCMETIIVNNLWILCLFFSGTSTVYLKIWLQLILINATSAMCKLGDKSGLY